jgi:hypothetical protein
VGTDMASVIGSWRDGRAVVRTVLINPHGAVEVRVSGQLAEAILDLTPDRAPLTSAEDIAVLDQPGAYARQTYRFGSGYQDYGLKEQMCAVRDGSAFRFPLVNWGPCTHERVHVRAGTATKSATTQRSSSALSSVLYQRPLPLRPHRAGSRHLRPGLLSFSVRVSAEAFGPY